MPHDRDEPFKGVLEYCIICDVGLQKVQKMAKRKRAQAWNINFRVWIYKILFKKGWFFLLEIYLKWIIALVILVWNIITFAIMNIDKTKAKKSKWRIKEKTIFISAFLLGAFGVFAGMYVFRHKTKHRSFKIGIPIIAIINIISIYCIYKNL